MAEEFSAGEGVKYIVVILTAGLLIVIASLLVYFGKISPLIGTLPVLVSYAALYIIIRNFKKRFLI